MSSFPFDRLPVELQLMVWQYARASLGQLAIASDLDLPTTTLFIRGRHNINRLKDYIRLFSICHNSRKAVLRNPPVLIIEGPKCRMLDYLDADAKPLTTKDWYFGRVFTDIIFDLCLQEHVRGPLGEGEGEMQRAPNFVLPKVLIVLFGSTVRRLHAIAGDGWRPISSAHRGLATATFPNSDARHFLIPGMGPTELREVARRHVHGVTLLNDVSDPITLRDSFVGRGHCHWSCDRGEALVTLATGMAPYFPDLEYISLVSWKKS